MNAVPDAATPSLEEWPMGAALIEHGRLRVVNDRLAAILRSSTAALSGRPLEEVLSPEDAAELADAKLGWDDDDGQMGPAQWRPVAGLDPDGAPWTGEMLDVHGPQTGRRIVLLEPASAPLSIEGRLSSPQAWPGPEVQLGVDRLLSHDVRGGLRGTGSFLTLLGRELGSTVSANATEYLATSRSAAARTDAMVERLVALMRARRRPYTLERVDLHDLMPQAVDRAGEQSGHAVEVLSAAPCPPVWADPVAVVDLLAELLTNAAKFSAPSTSPGPPPPVTVGLHEQRAGWAYLAVQDQGPGIEAEFCQDAFRPFRLLQPKGRFPGVGMGLAMSRVLAQAQGGRCWIQPGPGPGTQVIVRLAVASA